VKTTFASLFLALSVSAALGQKVGDTVTPEALGKLEWVQGEAPATWEPGKVYVLECWATWCGPCIAAIPHVDALYDKYKEQGLRVIGVNVWEDGKDKVIDFVKKKGEGMSYPIAYTGKGGVFETEWLKPAEVRGIPHAFIVKDGKVVLTSHPAQLTEELIEGLLAGGEKETNALASIKVAQEKQAALGGAMKAYQAAAAKKDVAAMEKAVADLSTLDGGSSYLPAMNFEVLVAKGDWAGAESTLAKLQGNPMRPSILIQAAQGAIKGDAPVEFRKSLVKELSTDAEAAPAVHKFQTLAKLQWSLGDKEEAVASATKGAEAAKAMSEKNPGFPVEPFTRFKESLAKGEMPTDEAFREWMQEAMKASRPTPAVPAKRVSPAVQVGG